MQQIRPQNGMLETDKHEAEKAKTRQIEAAYIAEQEQKATTVRVV